MTERGYDPPEEPVVYEVFMTESAKRTAASIVSRSDIAKISKMLRLLDVVPEIGRVYDPYYEAAQLPFEARVVHAGKYGIYYVVDDEKRTVIVFALEDQRRNPLNRFYAIEPHDL